ncbi:uncharacterized protein KIAA1958-like [Amphibalanus amphitrite]|uniref:uncharacterized protein KIAA1958-like n=1 Tax=Amphibalanus amphitrite TaxID=1232801 RepID=UPI001C9223FD|nr:uncharacterized protein KIAA1958-like [Amphibalanus amphitrite]
MNHERELPNFDMFQGFLDYDDEPDENVEERIDKFIQNQVPAATTKKTKSDIRKLDAFLQRKNETRPIETIPARELNIILCEFIMELNKDNGDPFEISTYNGVRYSLERHLKAVKHPQPDLSGKEYDKFRACLSAKVTIAKGAGKGNRPNRAMPLSEDDEKKLWTSGAMGKHSPKCLLRALWWKFTTGFGLRGVQEHRDMQWGDVKLGESSEGTFIEFQERATKTRKGACPGRPFTPKIYCTCEGQCSESCAVALFKLYEEKRHNKEHPAFYLAINYQSKEDWYKNQPLGNGSLSKMMKETAIDAGLEGNRFTNHSGRKTFIAQLTGHKSVSSLSSYAEADEKMQKRMSAVVAGESHPAGPVKRTEVVSRADGGQDVHAQSMSTGASGFSGNFNGCTFYVYSRN